MRGERLDKALARLGLGSRKEVARLGDLPRGQARHLSKEEEEALYRAAGLRSQDAKG